MVPETPEEQRPQPPHQDPTLLVQTVTRLGGSGSREKALSGHRFTRSPDGSGRSPASRRCISDGDVTGPNWRPYQSVTLGSKGGRSCSPIGRRCPPQSPRGLRALPRKPCCSVPWLMHVYACECVLEALHVRGHTSRPRRSLPGLSSETQSFRPGPRAWLPPHRLARPIGHSPSCRIPRWRPPAPPSPLSVHSSRDAPAAEHSGWGAAGCWPAPLRGPWGAGQAAPVPTQALLGVSVPLGPELPVSRATETHA